MQPYHKEELTEFFLNFFKEGEKDEGREIPHSRKSIEKVIDDNEKEAEYIHDFFFNKREIEEDSPEFMDAEEITYEFSQKITKIEIGVVLDSLYEKGLIDVTVDEKGEILYHTKEQ